MDPGAEGEAAVGCGIKNDLVRLRECPFVEVGRRIDQQDWIASVKMLAAKLAIPRRDLEEGPGIQAWG